MQMQEGQMRLWTAMLGAWLAAGSRREAAAAAAGDRVSLPIDPVPAAERPASADRRPETASPASREA
jgi:hypothetical protein